MDTLAARLDIHLRKALKSKSLIGVTIGRRDDPSTWMANFPKRANVPADVQKHIDAFAKAEFKK